MPTTRYIVDDDHRRDVRVYDSNEYPQLDGADRVVALDALVQHPDVVAAIERAGWTRPDVDTDRPGTGRPDPSDLDRLRAAVRHEYIAGSDEFVTWHGIIRVLDAVIDGDAARDWPGD